MVTTVQRWGNSLAIRIPKPFALETALSENCQVEIELERGRIVVSPARKEWVLEELMKKVTPSNVHREVRWGGRSGSEAW